MKREFNRVIYRFWHNLSTAGRVGYIGKDSHHPRRWCFAERAKDKESPKLYKALKKYPFNVWHKEILASGFRSDKSLNKAEIFYIKKFDSKNKGYNCTDGGDGRTGYKLSEATKKKISLANKGRKLSPEQVKKMQGMNKGNQFALGHRWSLKARKRMSETRSGQNHPLYGKRHSEESRKKMSLSAVGRKASLATRRKMSLSRMGNQYRKGTKQSEEAKRKISLANMGNQRAKGNVLSKEVKKQMSLRMKKRWKECREKRLLAEAA